MHSPSMASAPPPSHPRFQHPPLITAPRPPVLLLLLSLSVLLLSSHGSIPAMAQPGNTTGNPLNISNANFTALLRDLRTNGFFTTATLLPFLTISLLAPPMTLLIPADSVLSNLSSIPPIQYPAIIRYHVLHGSLPFARLRALPVGTSIPTFLSPDDAGGVQVTANNGGRYALDGVDVVRPDVCGREVAAAGIACHGMGGILVPRPLRSAAPAPEPDQLAPDDHEAPSPSPSPAGPSSSASPVASSPDRPLVSPSPSAAISPPANSGSEPSVAPSPTFHPANTPAAAPPPRGPSTSSTPASIPPAASPAQPPHHIAGSPEPSIAPPTASTAPSSPEGSPPPSASIASSPEGSAPSEPPSAPDAAAPEGSASDASAPISSVPHNIGPLLSLSPSPGPATSSISTLSTPKVAVSAAFGVGGLNTCSYTIILVLSFLLAM